MAKKALKPSIRFKGFTDPWEQCELGELTELSVGKSFSLDLVENGQYIVMDMGSVSQDGFIIDNKSTNTLRDLLKVDDLIMPKDDIGGGLIICKTAHINKENRYVLGDHAYKLHFHGHDGKFMKFLINSSRVNAEMKKKVTGSAQLGIKAENVKNTVLTFPTKDEQIKIGNLFSQIDSLITLHQRKYERLKMIKESMLQTMFPSENETIPRIRFKGFTDPWEQCKVGDIFTVTRGNVLALNQTKEYKTRKYCYPVYSSQTLNDGLMGYYKNYLFENAITWTTDGANAGTVRYRAEKFYSTNVNGVLISASGYSNEAVAEILNNVAWKYVSHVGNPKLMNNVMANIEITIPKSVDEQESISVLIGGLNNLITLHQRKHKKLIQVKKALLEKMFI